MIFYGNACLDLWPTEFITVGQKKVGKQGKRQKFDVLQITNKQTSKREIVICIWVSYEHDNNVSIFIERDQKDLSRYQRDSPCVHRRKEWWICLQSSEYFAKEMWRFSFRRSSVCIASDLLWKRVVAWSLSVRTSAHGSFWKDTIKQLDYELEISIAW